MTQSKDDLDRYYSTRPDPWEYATTKDDETRKRYILHALELFPPFQRVLDLGAGEGWLTKDLPALTKHGYELSDVAAARFPDSVQRLCHGQYDLVVATGVLYSHYDWHTIVGLIEGRASNVILTCNIKEWEVGAAIAAIPGKQVLDMEFPYRNFQQKLRVFQI